MGELTAHHQAARLVPGGTPIGPYNPDWAIVKEEDETVYLVRETKSAKEQQKLRQSEWNKFQCGRAHFEALDVDFDHVASANEAA